MTIVAVALGSNLGDRAAHLDQAVSRLLEFLEQARTSRYYETAPVDVPQPAGPFLNAAMVGTTSLSARGLLETLLAIEREHGRQRPSPNAPRTLDLDLILYGDSIIDEPGLIVPHPRFKARRFVLEPLAEIAAGLRDPITGQTVGELRRKIKDRR